MVQPIVREDGSVAIRNEEVFQEKKLRYGKKTLDGETYDEERY